MNRIRRVSQILSIVFVIIIVVLPLVHAFIWIYFDQFLSKGLGSYIHLSSVPLENIPIEAPITALTKAFGFLVSMITVGVDMLVFFFLVKLFRLYSRGDIFSRENVRYIKLVGYTLLIGQALSPISGALTTIVLTINNPVGKRMVSVGLGDWNISKIIIALMIIVVSWIMDEGRKLKEEEALVI